MNLIIGICVGAVVGWLAFRFLQTASDQGLRASLLIGLLGGGVGAQLAVMFGATDVTDGHFNVVSLFISAGAAVVSLVASRMIADRYRA